MSSETPDTSSEAPEVTRRPSNLNREILKKARVRAALAGITMKVWLEQAILEKVAREEAAEAVVQPALERSKKLVHA